MMNMKEMGLPIDSVDCFTLECFFIIKAEIDKQSALKEKHGKVNRRS